MAPAIRRGAIRITTKTWWEGMEGISISISITTITGNLAVIGAGVIGSGVIGSGVIGGVVVGSVVVGSVVGRVLRVRRTVHVALHVATAAECQ